MKSEITDKTATSVTLTISVDQDLLGSARTQTIDKLRAKVKVAGFRPGKAPDNIVEREVGVNQVASEALEVAVMQSYAKAMAEHKVEVIAPPEVSVTKFVPYTELEYTAKVDVMPAITLADYRNFKMSKQTVQVETSEINQTIEDLRKRLAVKTPVKRAAKSGDEVTLDFEGKKDGVPVEGAAAKNHVLQLGSNSFIPGFEEELIGLASGDKKEFTVTFPKDYHQKDLAGQPVTFEVSIGGVKEVVLPAVDDAFAAQIGQFKDINQLRSDIKMRLDQEKKEAAEQEFEQKVLEQLVDKSKYSVPKRLSDQQMERMKEELSQRLAASGLDFDKYLALAGKNAGQMESEMRPQAEKRVALAMILSHIAKQESISVSPSEIEAEVARLKSTYKDPQMQHELDEPTILEDVHNHLLASRTITKIMEYIQS